MKQSESSTSLTALTESSEAVCSFCNIREDLEAGNHLIYSKQFTGCGCEFTTHLLCWKEYMKRSGVKSGIGLCPMCQAPVGIKAKDSTPTVYVRGGGDSSEYVSIQYLFSCRKEAIFSCICVSSLLGLIIACLYKYS